MPAVETAPSSRTNVEEDLDELTSLLGETVRGLKHASPPPRELREAAERAALGPRHWPALLAVTSAEPLSVSELAKRLGLGLSTTSAIVGELSRAGLLDRTEDENDRRRTIVRLHERHRDAITSWTTQALGPLRRTLEALSPEARAHFMQGWRVLHAQTTAAAEPAWRPRTS
jgi:DNA-binding MarR family transcriptional regulator